MKMEAPTKTFRPGLLALKLLVLAAVVWGVWRTLERGWGDLADYHWQVTWPWVLVAGACYIAGLLPAAWYWRRTMLALGGRPDWALTLQAYFVGHLAKYVPGKVLVLVLRAGMLPRQQVPIRVAVVGVFLETLTTMAVGAVLVAALSPLILELDQRMITLAVMVAIAVGLPTLPPVARWIIRRVSPGDASEVAPAALAAEGGSAIENIGARLERIGPRLMVEGWLASCLFWVLLGASLGATLLAVGANEVSLQGGFPLMVAAVALATVAGFVSMLPGGLGVRDALIIGLLAPRFGDATALVAGVGLRLIWIISELVVCVILYLGCKRFENRSP